MLLEVHDQPEEALSDGRQALSPEEFKQLVPVLNGLHDSLRSVDSRSGGAVASTRGMEEV